MSLNFDSAGSNRSVSHGSGASLDDLAGAGAVSLAGWFYRTTNGDNQHMIVKGSTIFTCTNAPGEGALQLAFLRATTTTNYISVSGVLPLNTWKFIVATFQDSATPEVNIYHGTMSTAMAATTFGTAIDGAGTVNTDAADNLIVGNRNALDLPFRGRIDGAGVWSTVLTLAQAEQIRNLAPEDWDTVGTCKLATDYHVASGSMPDYSGNSNTGTITSATLSESTIGVMIAPDPADANVYFSPWNWYSNGGGAMSSNNIMASSTYAQTNTPGAYFKFNLTLGSDTDATRNVALHLDLSMLSATTANNPSIGVSIDDGPYTLTTLTVQTPTNWRLSIASALSAGTHTFRVAFKALDLNTTGDRWSTPTRLVKVIGIEADYSATSALPTLGTKKVLIFGDSHSEGANAVGTGLLVADTDANQTFGAVFGLGYDAEYGVVAFGGQGYTRGVGNVVASSSAPALYNATDASQSWNKYSSGKSRLVSSAFSPVPDVIIIEMGANDSSPSASDITACVDAIRTAAGTSCWIFGLVPFTAANASTIATAYAAVASPAKTVLYTPGISITSGTASLWSLDAGAGSQHLSVRGHARMASELMRRGQASILASSGGGLLTHPGMSGGMRG